MVSACYSLASHKAAVLRAHGQGAVSARIAAQRAA
jgi:hypothetical protein